MTNIRVTTTEVKHKVIWAAVELMRRSGLLVTEHKLDNTVTLTVVIPPDSTDPHGDRMKAINASST
jgi:hypothetical protein